MAGSFKTMARDITENSRHSTTFEQGGDCWDELLIDIEEPIKDVINPDAEEIMNENLSEEKYSDGYGLNSEDLSARNNDGAQRVKDSSEFSYLNELADKFSKMDTSAKYSDNCALNPNTCHSDYFEVLEQKSQSVLEKETNFKYQEEETLKASNCSKTRGLFVSSETPGDLCTKFKTLIGSNEKLITLDNVRDIRLKNKDFSEFNCHAFDKHKQHVPISKSKDIIDTNIAKSERGGSSNNATIGQILDKSEVANSASDLNIVFIENTLTEKNNIKARTEKPKQGSEDKLIFNFPENLNLKHIPKKDMLVQSEYVLQRSKLKHRRIGLPAMQYSVNELDTFQFVKRNSVAFGLPKPNWQSSHIVNKKPPRKRLSNSPAKNEPYHSTSSTKRRRDSQPDEPGSKFRKRCLSSTDAETVESRYRIRSSSDGSKNININDEMKETRESPGNELLFISSNLKRGVDERLLNAIGEPLCTSKKMRHNDNLNPMQ